VENVPSRKTRIVHVAPYFEAGNPFGGPLSVAMNLVRQLSLDECNPILLAGNRSREKRIEGVQSRLFHSFRIYNNTKITGLFSPHLIFWIIRTHKNILIMHIHLAREMNTIISAIVAKYFGIPYVVQTHGMIRKPKNRIEMLFDKLFTRGVIRNSQVVLYLTVEERRRLEQVESRANFRKFANAVSTCSPRIDFDSKKSEVIFISRLHYNKQPLVFLEIALEIAIKYPETKFTIIGPDGGELQEIMSRLSSFNSENVKYEGILNPADVQGRLSVSTIFVLPTLADVFPIVLLEAMASGCAIVTTTACEISSLVKDNALGMVTDPIKQEIQNAIEWLLMNPTTCQIMGKSAEEYAILHFDTVVNSQILRSEVYGF
jgi:glycosyltransferase involved in cell wall biosynthesis